MTDPLETVAFLAGSTNRIRVLGALALDVVDDVECSVLLAEQARSRSITQRIFGK